MLGHDLTLDYGDRGREAVKRLLAEGPQDGHYPHKTKSILSSDNYRPIFRQLFPRAAASISQVFTVDLK